MYEIKFITGANERNRNENKVKSPVCSSTNEIPVIAIKNPTVGLLIHTVPTHIELQVDSKLPFDPDTSIRFRQFVARESRE